MHYYEDDLLRSSSMVLSPTGFLPLFLLQAWSSLHPECELIFQLREEERSCLQHIAQLSNQSSEGPCLLTETIVSCEALRCCCFSFKI